MVKQTLDLRLIAHQIGQMVAKRRFPLMPETIEVIHADDGTPSLGVPLSEFDSLIVTPSLTDLDRYAVLHNSGKWGTTVIARSITPEEDVELIRESI